MDPPITVNGGYQMVMSPGDNQVCRALSQGLPWEEHTTRIIRESLKPGDRFVDCGAHIGWFSIVGSKAVGPTGKVFAFEPWKGNYEILEENLRLNGCHNVIASNLPLWSSNARLLVKAPPSDNSGDARTNPSDSPDAVEALTLDNWFKPDSVQLVKIDCQDSDAEILVGGRRLFTQSKRIRFVVESPGNVPELFGIPLKFKTQDNNYFYEKGYE